MNPPCQPFNHYARYKPEEGLAPSFAAGSSWMLRCCQTYESAMLFKSAATEAAS